MFGIFRENEDHFTEHMASPSEACSEYVNNFGMDNPDRAEFTAELAKSIYEDIKGKVR